MNSRLILLQLSTLISNESTISTAKDRGGEGSVRESRRVRDSRKVSERGKSRRGEGDGEESLRVTISI